MRAGATRIITVGEHSTGRRLFSASYKRGLREARDFREAVRVRFEIQGVAPSVDVHHSHLRTLGS